MPATDPVLRRLASQKAAHTSWSRTSDRSARTLAARRAADARFEREVDPNNELTPEERAKRAESARKAWYAGIALRSAQARRKAPKDAA